MNSKMVKRKVVINHLAPGQINVDEVSRLSKDSAGTTTVKCIVRYITKSKIKIITKYISTLIEIQEEILYVLNRRIRWKK